MNPGSSVELVKAIPQPPVEEPHSQKGTCRASLSAVWASVTPRPARRWVTRMCRSSSLGARRRPDGIARRRSIPADSLRPGVPRASEIAHWTNSRRLLDPGETILYVGVWRTVYIGPVAPPTMKTRPTSAKRTPKSRAAEGRAKMDFE